MNWLIDIFLLIISLATILIYTFKGFIKSFLGLFKFIAAFLIAYLFASPIGAWISEACIFAQVNDSIYNWLSNILSQAESHVNIKDVVDKIPDAILTFFESVGVSAESVISQQGASFLTADNIHEISRSIASPVSIFISTAIAFVLIFVLSIIVLAILIFLLDKIFQSPGLKQINRTLGLILGTACAFVNLIVICSALTLILDVVSMNNPELSSEAIKESTVIYKLISNLNVFSWLF